MYLRVPWKAREAIDRGPMEIIALMERGEVREGWWIAHVASLFKKRNKDKTGNCRLKFLISEKGNYWGKS